MLKAENIATNGSEYSATQLQTVSWYALKITMRNIFYATVVLCVLALVGCKRSSLDTEFVTGTVTLDGVPIEKVRVGFNPKDGGIPSFGRTDASGKYVITSMQGGGKGKGAVAGEYQVTFSKPEPVLVDEKAGRYETKHLLHLVYLDPKQTPFEATVVKGKNEFDFDLKTDPGSEVKAPPGFQR